MDKIAHFGRLYAETMTPAQLRTALARAKKNGAEVSAACYEYALELWAELEAMEAALS